MNFIELNQSEIAFISGGNVEAGDVLFRLVSAFTISSMMNLIEGKEYDSKADEFIDKARCAIYATAIRLALIQ